MSTDITKEEVYKLASINNPIINDNGNRIEFENGECYAKDTFTKLYHRVKVTSGQNNSKSVERKIDEVFEYNAVKLKVIEHPNQFTLDGTCSEDCYFYDKAISVMCSHRNREITGQCQYDSRKDCKSVYFKKVEDENN